MDAAEDEVGIGLLQAARQLQDYAATVLGLQLDYVTPDLQGGTGWIAAGRPQGPASHPVLLHFRRSGIVGGAPGPDGGARLLPGPARLSPSAPAAAGSVTLAQYLEEAAEPLLPPSTPGRPSTGAVQPPQQPDHPNLAVLLDPAAEGAALLGGSNRDASCPVHADTISAAYTGASADDGGCRAASIGAAWLPGCSLEECLRNPQAAAACGLSYGGSSTAYGTGAYGTGPYSSCGAGEHHLRFLLLQLVAAVTHAHARGCAFGGGLSAATMQLQPGGWLQLLPPPPAPPPPPSPLAASDTPSSPPPQPRSGPPVPPLPRLPACLCPGPPTLPALTRAWQAHALSNLDYLLLLNLLAGRRLGDRTAHPFVPWVTDFGVHPRIMLGLGPGPEVAVHGSGSGPGLGPGHGPGVEGGAAGGADEGEPSGGVGGGWHDLSRSRYRQAKGDLQLDVTYASSYPPHHIPQEPLSELSYCIYMARVTPRAVLCRAVRSNFEPREYPPSLAAMLGRSPDEAAPQLYTEPGVFRSQHPELPDLQLPAWAASPEDFVAWHRCLLESDHVSARLHTWIDLMFGHQLLGAAAVAAKNVHLHHGQGPHGQGQHLGGGHGPATGGSGAGAGAGGGRAAGAGRMGAAGAVEAPYAPTGMHAPLFLTPHPPRKPRPAGRAPWPSPGTPQSGTGAAETRSAFFGAAVGAVGGGGVGGGGAGSVLRPLDSLELLGAAAEREGGLALHEAYFAPPQPRGNLGGGSGLSRGPSRGASGSLAVGAALSAGDERSTAWRAAASSPRPPAPPQGQPDWARQAAAAWLDGEGSASPGRLLSLPSTLGLLSPAGPSGEVQAGDGAGAEEAAVARPTGQGTDGEAGGALSAEQLDCRAIGAVAVQLWLRRAACPGPLALTAYWRGLAARLPGAVRRFVRLCFEPTVTAERLLSDPFFGPELHAAHAFLRTTLYDRDLAAAPPVAPVAAGEAGPVAAGGMSAVPRLPPPPPALLPSQLAALAAAATAGRLDELAEHRHALDLCLPHVMCVLWRAGAACGATQCGASAGQASAVTMAGQVYDILETLLRLLPPDRVVSYVMPYVCACLSYFAEDSGDNEATSSHGGPPAAAKHRCLALQVRLLSASFQIQLLQASDLDLFVQHVVPLLLAALLCTEREALPDLHGMAGTLGWGTGHADGGGAGGGGGGGGSNHSGGALGGVARALAAASISDAAAATLAVLAAQLPLPLLIERLVGPLLGSLTVGTSVPRLLVQLCAGLGGPLTARHVAPALLHLAVQAAPPPPASAAAAKGRAAAGSAAAQPRSSKSGMATGGPSAATAGTTMTSSDAAAPLDAAVQQQIFAALSVLTAVLDLLPREFIPRVFLHGLSPPPPPPSAPGPASGAAADGSGPSASGGSMTGSAPPVVGGRGGGGGGGGAGTGGAASVPPLLACLLNPAAFRVAPGSLTVLAALALRAFARLARPENLALVVLPHLMPLLKDAATPRRRAAYRANATWRRRRGGAGGDDDDAARSPDQSSLLSTSAAAAAALAAMSGSVGSRGGGERAIQRSHSSPCTDRDGAASSAAAGAAGGGGGAGPTGVDEEDGYWELVHCVYGCLVHSSGLLTVRNLLPGWQAVEAGLTSRMGWSPAAATSSWSLALGPAAGAAAAAFAFPGSGSPDSVVGSGGGSGSAGGGGGGGSAGGGEVTYELQQAVRQEIMSKQQQVAALHGTHLFIKEVGWSAPNSLASSAGRSSPKDVPGTALTTGGGGAGGGAGTSAISAGGAGLAAAGGGGGKGAGGAFVWPQLLAIGSPTIVEGLAARAAAGGGHGGGGGNVSRQASGGGAALPLAPATPVARKAGADGAASGLPTSPHEPSPRSSRSTVSGGADGDAGSNGGVSAAVNNASVFTGDAAAAAATAAAHRPITNPGAVTAGHPPLLLSVRSEPGAELASAAAAAAAPPPASPSSKLQGASTLPRSSRSSDGTAAAQLPPPPPSPPASLVSPLLLPPPLPAELPAPDSGTHRWAWLPPVPTDVSAIPVTPGYSGGGGAGGGGVSAGAAAARVGRARLLAAAAAPPSGDVWRLQASVVHSWPAHRVDRIRAVAVHPYEHAVLTAGRGAVGGREGAPVVRVWGLSDCQARVQYGGHRTAVTSLLVLRAARGGGAVAASLDAGGQLHVWDVEGGKQLAVFAAPHFTAGAAAAGGASGAGAGGAAASGGGGAAGDAAAEADAAGGGGANGSPWGDLIARSGRYHQQLSRSASSASASFSDGSSQGQGWQSLGGLQTSHQLASTTGSGASGAFSRGGGGGGAGAGGLGGGGGAAAGPGTPAAGGGPAGAGGGLRLGFTALCAAPEESRLMYAGTADARLCCLDLERGRVVAEWLAAPSVRHDDGDAVTSLATPASGGGSADGGGVAAAAAPWLAAEVVAVGSRAGRIVVLDRRCGTAVVSYRAHGGEISSMASYGSHGLVTSGSDRLLRIWDLRRCGGSTASAASTAAAAAAAASHTVGSGYEGRTGPWSGWEGPRGLSWGGGDGLWGIVDAMSPAGVGAAVLYGADLALGGGPEVVLPPPPPGPAAVAVTPQGVAAPALLRGFALPKEGAQGLRVLRDCVLMTSGSSVGVLSLSDAGGSGSGGGGPSFARLRNGKGGREGAAITGLAVLPCCRLLVTAGEDGVVRICK
ncbi:hypothetical protein HYH03_014392 [Edaphochlamys debaryana]|uniref:BEACH domain-containing protein n=1 Tax=Edaphochlamys debaryana TaxID=47281 RepID=A0A835XLH8_9CHLO|nr:hypothetical protein HYH03_014392 [Edaphochlamys debaryana]|eukprot:KAG2487022.1 hypothetical protein HYH03_014392 [Edaphochlamys debaryana]